MGAGAFTIQSPVFLSSFSLLYFGGVVVANTLSPLVEESTKTKVMVNNVTYCELYNYKRK